ncbi:GlxA family transcriptional regulator [Streptomyces sp. NPDC056291]|uniref:GlxA family transcriptional regulator n=1 Tax=Streptomyces sp. NPDC056291 TaxID=3345772 RepID=UPI0035D8B6DF
MRKKHATHRVAVVTTPNAPLFEIAVPCEIFGMPRPDLIDPPYEVTLCATVPGERVGSGFTPDATTLDALEEADTVVVPACADVDDEADEGLVSALKAVAERGARVVGLCSGAFALAAAGLLDGRRATTHWMYADKLARRFPLVKVDAAVLYTAEGNIFTSAGTAAAIDLCLELVRRDHGAAVVNELARRLVVAPHRGADQAQFIAAPVPTETDSSLGPILEWARENLHRPFRLADLAARAHVSQRTLIRRFQSEHGLQPSHWLREQRLRRAQSLLESTQLSIEEVAAQSGFGTPASMRHNFARFLHTSPTAYRNSFAK